jgi:hypothetical protein
VFGPAAVRTISSGVGLDACDSVAGRRRRLDVGDVGVVARRYGGNGRDDNGGQAKTTGMNREGK